MNYPFNVRSFFTNRETKDIGAGLELWVGRFLFYFILADFMLLARVLPVHSSCDGQDANKRRRVFVLARADALNDKHPPADISTGTMYKHGPLLRLCLEYIGKNDPNALSPKRGFPDRERLRLQRFISGIRVLTTHAGPSGEVQTPRVIKKLSTAGASSLTFQMREGQTMTVADYFKNTQNKPLQFPDVICCEVGSGALIPLGTFSFPSLKHAANSLLELCTVPPGQVSFSQGGFGQHLTGNQVDEEASPSREDQGCVRLRSFMPTLMLTPFFRLDFATKKPADRLRSITNGLGVCLTLFVLSPFCSNSSPTGSRLWAIRIRPPIRDDRRPCRGPPQGPGQGLETANAEIRCRFPPVDYRPYFCLYI
jgi:eukaryotic translation initiation factor 2C